MKPVGMAVIRSPRLRPKNVRLRCYRDTPRFLTTAQCRVLPYVVWPRTWSLSDLPPVITESSQECGIEIIEVLYHELPI